MPLVGNGGSPHRHHGVTNILVYVGAMGNRNSGEAREVVVEGNHQLTGGKSLRDAREVLQVTEKSRKIQALEGALDAVVRRGIPQWLDLEKENMKGIVKEFPSREDITTPIQEQLIVELYSK